MHQFRNVLSSLTTIKDFLASSRFVKKGDFYGLFGAVLRVSRDGKSIADLTQTKSGLKKFDRELAKDPTVLTEPYSSYYGTVIEGPNKLPKRKERIDILTATVKEHLS